MIIMRATAKETESETVYRLWVALYRGRPVTLTYQDEPSVETIRTIEPHSFKQSKDGNMLVLAMCRLRKELRVFRIDRITHYTIHRGTFLLELPEAPDPNEITDWWSFTSRTQHEIAQVKIAIPDGLSISEQYEYVREIGLARSAKVRAVWKAEHGIGMQRLRRRDVKRIRQAA